MVPNRFVTLTAVHPQKGEGGSKNYKPWATMAHVRQSYFLTKTLNFKSVSTLKNVNSTDISG